MKKKRSVMGFDDATFIFNTSGSLVSPDEIRKLEVPGEDETNAIGLIQQALIFARNNSNEFFSTKLMKETTFEQHHLERLTNNYINHNKLSIKK